MFSIIRNQIPNYFTLGNLVCGVLAIILTTHFQFKIAANLIFLAAILDFFDGFIARLLKVSGELGKQLDSLADCVTFGVAPSILALYYALTPGKINGYALGGFILIAIFSAYRLAKFNIDTRQSDSFIGVPTPITGLMIASFAYIMEDYSAVFLFIFNNPIIYNLFCLFVSILLVSEIPLVALKFKNKISFKNYPLQIILFVLSALSIVIFKWLSVPIIYLMYV